MSALRTLVAVLAASAVACAPQAEPCPASPTDPPDPPATSSAPVAVASASASAAEVRTDADDPELRAVLEQVSKARELPIRERVRVTTSTREELLEKTKRKVAEEIPAGVIDLQGELLRSLGLVPPDYEVLAGLLKLVTARVAGFYDPDDRTMYIIDDLTHAQKEETLGHELVHALQDQAFRIGPLLDYKAGEGDRMAAIQLLVEGDATSAAFDLAYGSAFAVDADALQASFLLATSMSEVGRETPPVLIASLIAPYTDGFAFAQALRSHGGWKGVDLAFKELPESTEQALHPEKYFAKERPVPVPTPPLTSLGEGFEAALVDTNGELGLRLMLEQWTARKVAVAAAAGWGGDRYVVARRKQTEHAVAMLTRMDTARDATELAVVIERRLGRGCVERADFGPTLVKTRHRDVLVLAGPYERTKSGAVSRGSCETSAKWSKEILAAVPR